MTARKPKRNRRPPPLPRNLRARRKTPRRRRQQPRPRLPLCGLRPADHRTRRRPIPLRRRRQQDISTTSAPGARCSSATPIPPSRAAIAEQAKRGTSYGVTTELELELASLINRAIPALEKIRFVSSGTEATMSAVRLARGVTKRDYIVKFRGCYHGHADSFLSEAGSGLATLSIAECPGVPQALAQLTLNAPYNNLNAVEHLFSEHQDKIAAVIVEPIAANMGVVLPEPGFLAGLREITRKNGALLIVDEVITGFRIHNGAVQQFLGIEADLTTLGKIIGGGLPVAAYGGRAELMNHVAPLGPIYQAGTLAGNPLAMRAGIATLKQLTVTPLPRHRRKSRPPR